MKKLLLSIALFSCIASFAQVTITDKGNYIEFTGIPVTKQFVKPYNINIKVTDIEFVNDFERYTIAFSTISVPSLGSPELLRDSLMTFNNSTTSFGSLDEINVNVESKINRIKGSDDYNRAFTYDLVGTENVLTITHTGTTANGAEAIVETLTYVDPAVNGSNITNISYN